MRSGKVRVVGKKGRVNRGRREGEKEEGGD